VKKINELTEQEILNLSTEGIDKMIKFRMAEEGIKFIDYPTKPEYHEVPKPTTKVYYCHLLGTSLSFTDMEELNSVLEVINGCKSICSVDNNYDLSEGHKYYMKDKIENATWSTEAPDTIVPITVYTHKEYSEVKEKLKENAKNKKDFKAKLKEYDNAIKDAQWVRDEIMERVNEITSKYNKLGNYIHRFNSEYLPLADNNKEIAMKFLNKAYSLTKEEQEYVLANHENQTSTMPKR